MTINITKIKNMLLMMIVFLAGLISRDFYATSNAILEKPFSIISFSTEKPSPQDWITEDKIKVYEDKVIIDIKNAEWASFTNTNSMDPVIDEKANAIQIKPKSERDIAIGDIISYKSEYADDIIIHRVINIGYDEKGWYCIAKGDNNPSPDPGKIRFNQIERVLVAIIY